MFDKPPTKNLSRKEQIIITRLRIWHTRITHQHIFTKDRQEACNYCLTPMSVEHILIYCPKYEEERRKLNLKNNMKDILNDTQQCSNVIKLIQNIKMYDSI